MLDKKKEITLEGARRAFNRQNALLAIMLSRMNCCVGFGRTGYPLTLAMKVDEGRYTCRNDSAAHLLRTPKVVGSAGERSNAMRNNNVRGLHFDIQDQNHLTERQPRVIITN